MKHGNHLKRPPWLLIGALTLCLGSIARAEAQAESPCHSPSANEMSFACEMALSKELITAVGSKIIDKHPASVAASIYEKLPSELREKYSVVEMNGRYVLRTKGAKERKIEIPKSLENTAKVLEGDGKPIRLDARSELASHLEEIDETTVAVASVAYDIQDLRAELGSQEANVDLSDLGEIMKSYKLVRTYTDDYSGFKGLILESLPKPGKPRHRIYAAAGTEVFTRTDFRDWASGLMMARPQIVSDASLKMIEDAAQWTASGNGEVVFTGQSQGGVIAQGLGFLAQVRLDQINRSNRKPKGFVHVTSWGATGGIEPIAKIMESAFSGEGRGFSPKLERHWELTSPESEASRKTWKELEEELKRIPLEERPRYIQRIAEKMRAVGYFFEMDTFAKVGTFLGTTFMFPKDLVTPLECEPLRLQEVLPDLSESAAVTLEGHFLNGYKRAVRRGGITVSRPAIQERWDWVLQVQSALDPVGEFWLNGLYLGRLGESAANWEACLKSRKWQTDRNRRCEAGYWSGCSKQNVTLESAETGNGPNWCLLIER